MSLKISKISLKNWKKSSFLKVRFKPLTVYNFNIL